MLQVEPQERGQVVLSAQSGGKSLGKAAFPVSGGKEWRSICSICIRVESNNLEVYFVREGDAGIKRCIVKSGFIFSE